MTLTLIGKKEGMTQVFDKNGNLVVCTVISASPNVVSQIKSVENDGYQAVQLGGYVVPEKKLKRLKKPQKGHFSKTKTKPCKYLKESRIENADEYKIGQEIDLAYFEEVEFVDVKGVSKGKGFQGVMKLHGYSGGPAAHGSGFHRTAGSTGMRSTPGRSLPGGKRASRMGCDKMTTQNLRVVGVDIKNQVILVKGAVPGSRGSVVYIQKAKKK